MFISMKTTTDKGCTITLLDIASFQLQKLSLHIVTTTGYAFSSVMNKILLAALVEISTSGGNPLSHSCYDGIIVRKMLPA
jgi:hypothetical protein